VVAAPHRRALVYLLIGAALVLSGVAFLTGPGPQSASPGPAPARHALPAAEVVAELPPDGGPHFNRLVHEQSPYLLQHAANPVNWFPWGPEAFARARREDKPIFLSVGYSTCYWCHVMMRESFEDEQVAALLNEHFVAIKVDREQRPDVDKVYMQFTTYLTGQGGWPNSVWLTPDGRPWFAGTYFPPEDRPGMAGFKTVLLQLEETWRGRREEVEQHAEAWATLLKRLSAPERFRSNVPLGWDLVNGALDALRQDFDPRHGGFGGAPKFPPHGALRLLLHEFRRTREEGLLEMATGTLSAVAKGGIRDHLGGGFHRYATDDQWRVPHFEKMLYDNALLVRAFVDAYLLTGEDLYRRAAAETCDWVLREMTDEGSGFHSAVDAESEGREGKFYLWTMEETLEVLGPEVGELFCRAYGVKRGGNFHHEATERRSGASILFMEKAPGELSAEEDIPRAELRERLDDARARLRRRRASRERPHVDDKVLADWNGLMIGSLAHAGRHLNEPAYTAAA
jgi:uncharacterized protein YyaL (SSP411 family)